MANFQWISIAYLCVTGTAAFAQPIILDPFFGDAGIVEIESDSCSGYKAALAFDSEGRILAGGHLWCGPERPLTLRRFLSDGEPDTTFGDQGLALAYINETYAVCGDIWVLSDGKLLMAAGYGAWGFEPMVLVRFQSNGELDTSFGVGGVRKILEFPPSWPNSIAVQNDGRIIVAGLVHEMNNFRAAVFRFMDDGSPDSTFANNGLFSYPIIGSWCWANDIELLDDGNMMITGTGGSSGNYDVFVARILGIGQFDPTFGSGGRTIVSYSNGDDDAAAMTVLDDGSSLIAGSIGGSSDIDMVVAKFDPQGNLDQSFGTDGLSVFSVSMFRDRARDIAVLPDGKILIVGKIEPSLGQNDLALARLTPDGELDLSLNGNGFVITDLGGTTDRAMRSLLLPNDKILVLGQTEDPVLLQYLLSPWNSIVDRPMESSILTVIPDPGMGTLELLHTAHLSAPVHCHILASDGRSIRILPIIDGLPPGDHRSRLDVGDLAAGIYLLSVSDGEVVRCVRFIWH